MIPVKSIRVGPFDFCIKPMQGEERDNNLGTCSSTTLTIGVRDNYATAQQEAETVLHELLHAIFAVYGIRPKTDGEEGIVARLSVGMAAAIRDNQKFTQWLIQALK